MPVMDGYVATSKIRHFEEENNLEVKTNNKTNKQCNKQRNNKTATPNYK